MPYRADHPKLLPCWQAHVTVGPMRDQGTGPSGQRLIIPITGGHFEGTLDPAGAARPFGGKVLPGGFDLQRLRPDGNKELEAIYHLETDDGTGIEIRNHALLTYSAPGVLDYGRSRICIEAPMGPYGWLNDRIFIGTLEPIRPFEEVLIRAFVVE